VVSLAPFYFQRPFGFLTLGVINAAHGIQPENYQDTGLVQRMMSVQLNDLIFNKNTKEINRLSIAY
jgi:hypothetical protein